MPLPGFKAECRREVLRQRRELSLADRESKSRCITERVLALDSYGPAKTVLSYLAKADEVDTEDLVRAMLAAGKQVLVPVTQPNTGIILPVRLLDFDRELVPGPYGIREPAPEFWRPVAPAAIDLVLVPGVAFDRQGNRLGFGKGYYDRFFRAMDGRARRIALAFSLQIVPAIPREEHDVPVELIVTEDQVIDCRWEEAGWQA